MNEQSLKAKLKHIAKEKDVPFNDIWKNLLLERFLSRLSLSQHSDQFIFKGGLLLSFYVDLGRETRDIDFLLTKLKAREGKIQQALVEICNCPSTDGFYFELVKIESTEHLHMFYSGFRVSIRALFRNMKDIINIDIAVGDTVTPIKESLQLFQYKTVPLFEGEISLSVYPLETIVAEKIETMVKRGATNSRMKDFHDVFLLTQKSLLDSEKVKENILTTFKHRKTSLNLPLQFNKDAQNNMQALWDRHIRGLGDMAKEIKLPFDFSKIIATINHWLASLGLY
jgi:predicted nucleotidyltransferase component of viral defense system